jgi:hypothetical protein
MVIIYIVLAYLFVVFILSRLIIPHYGFKEESVPDTIPRSMAKEIDNLKNQARTSEQFLKLAYDFVGLKYRSERLNTILKFHCLFKTLDQAWAMTGYVPCTISSYILKIFLVRSGFFKENEVGRKYSFVNFILHQYLRVKVDGQWLDVDVGERQRNLPLGQHLKYFG